MEKKSGAEAMDYGEPKKPRTIWKAAVPNKQKQQQDEGDDPKILHVSLNLDALECPLCFFPFEASIFQNGHAVCGSCCARLSGTCSSCRAPIGDIQCRPLENAIAAMEVPCAFAGHGCVERLRFVRKRVHEASSCKHAPCACPLPGLAFSGSVPLLHDHVRDEHAAAGGDAAVVIFAVSTQMTLHRSMLFRVLLHDLDARVFLLLNGGDVPSGRSLSVVCVCPSPGVDGRALAYTMEVRGGGEPGGLSLSASGPITCTHDRGFSVGAGRAVEPLRHRAPYSFGR